jgi:PAS domain S-box-containing protein
MKANTALGFVLAGLSLTLLARANLSALELRLSQFFAGVTALIGFLTICQYLFDVNFGIDQILFLEPVNAVGTLSPGRMAPNTAINFLLLGCALFIINFHRSISVAQVLLLLAGLIGLVSLIGYFYGVTAFIGIGHYTQMAVHTAVLFIVMSIGGLALCPADGIMRTITSDTIGGWLLRHLLPFTIVVPIVLGWLRVNGERYGHFESAFGVALTMVCMMMLFSGLIWWFAKELNRIDKSRRQSEADLRASEENYRLLFREMQNGFALHEIICDEAGNPSDYRFLAVNPAFERMTGLKAAETVGRTVLEILPDTERSWIEHYGKVALTGEPVCFENYAASMKKHFEVIAFRPKIKQFACVISDITERKQAAEQLRQQGEKLQARNEELSQLNRLMTGRELRMIELKQQINGLAVQLGQPQPHLLAFMDAAAAEILRTTPKPGEPESGTASVEPLAVELTKG